jgi:hypothetical protein
MLVLIKMIKQKGKGKLVEMIMKQQKKGHSPMILVTGRTGTFKSLGTLTICSEILDLKDEKKGEEFINNNLFVDIRDFVRKIRKAKKEILIIDEAGIHLYSKTWQSDFNRYFYQIVQTQRHRNNIYFVILPVAMSLAKDHRRMIDFEVEMIGKKIDPKNKNKALYGIANVYLIAHRHGAFYSEDIKRKWLFRAKIYPPSDSLISAYKQRENKEKRKILEGIVKKLNIKERCDHGTPLENECDMCEVV